MRRRRIDPTTIIIAALCTLVAVAAVFLIMEIASVKNSHAPADASLVDRTETAWGSKLTYKDQKYTQKDGLTTVLLLGVDYGGEEDDRTVGTGGRADTIVLLILDDKAKTSTTLSVNRDTITEVDLYDNKGEYMYSGDMQINMQYAFGDSRNRANYLMKKTVSELICGRRIDGTVALSLDGIPVIADLIGGLTLTMNEDYTYIDPRFTKGATMTLNGEDLEHFIRYRDVDETGSNEVRMARHQWLIQQLFEALGSNGMSELAEKIMDGADDYIETDLDAETIKKIAQYKMNEEGLKVPGQTVEGENHDEFYVDQASLEQLLLELFYDPSN